MELVDLSDIFRGSQFKVFRGALDSGGVVKCINAKGFATITTGQIEDLTNLAKAIGRKRARVHQSRGWRMEIADREIFHGSGESGAHPSARISRKATCFSSARTVGKSFAQSREDKVKSRGYLKLIQDSTI